MMKNVSIAALSLLMLFTACCKDSKDEPQTDSSGNEPAPASLVTPQLRMSVADPLAPSLFTGILEIYPCNENTSVYFGNYMNGSLTIFNNMKSLFTTSLPSSLPGLRRVPIFRSCIFLCVPTATAHINRCMTLFMPYGLPTSGAKICKPRLHG